MLTSPKFKKSLIYSALFALAASSALTPVAAQQVDSQLWQQFVQAKEDGTEPTLPDFSYAGYDYSQSAIPDTSGWLVFLVTDYGAVPDDGLYDDAAIQSAIDAAELAGGGVVSFPAGRFMISPDELVGGTPSNPERVDSVPDELKININGSNIVLKGAGAGDGGTEIFKDKMKVNNGDYIIEIKPANLGESTLTTVSSDATRESYQIEVANGSALAVGQRILLRTSSVNFAENYYSDLGIDSDWLRLLGTDPGSSSAGFQLREIHTVAAIDGNMITLREPLHINLVIPTDDTIDVRSYNMIDHVGIEDIRFKGNWDNYPEDFVHHQDDVHDYAWNAIRFDNVENSWVRNVELKDWNQGIYIDGAAAMTLENIRFTGKKGHTSVHTRRSYGILVKDSQDAAAHHHGPGLGYWGCGTVYLRYQMSPGQRMDSHSGSPYSNLFDNVTNGHFDGNGGPHESYPHHGKYFVAWNNVIEGGPSNYNFWPSSRNGHTFAQPYFSGLRGQSVSMTDGTFGANESPGQQVEPESLFEAQLALRLGTTPAPTPIQTPVQNPAETPAQNPALPVVSIPSAGGSGGLGLMFLILLSLALFWHRLRRS